MTPAEIKTLREKLGLTQSQLANKIGVNQVTVNRWERGHKRPSPMALNQLHNLSL